jgi:hypothetical protein
MRGRRTPRQNALLIALGAVAWNSPRSAPIALLTAIAFVVGDYLLFERRLIFFQDLEVRKPDYFLSAAQSTPAETIGAVIGKVDAVLAQVQPEALLVLGDTKNAGAFQFFTWKQGIGASTSECPRRSIGASLITPQTSTSRTARLLGSICCGRVCHRKL